jgi:hypothetical protein
MVKRAPRRCLHAGAIGALLALAGCDGNPNFDLSKLLSQPTPDAPVQTADAPAHAPMPTPGQTAAIPPSPQLGQLHDKSAADVEALVGNPDFRRAEPPAELWQYRTADCVVDLFFYGKGKDRRVVHEDARGRDPTRGNDERCGDGSEVLKNRQRGGAG